MNNLFYSLSFIFLLFTTHISAIIIEASDFKVIEREINQLDDNALVVFDIDYTLIIPNDLILAPCGEVYRQEFMKKLRALEEQGEVLDSKVLLKSQDSLVDEKILDLLAILKKKKIKTIGLTAMSTGKFGLIPNAEEWRVKQLSSLGINFFWSFPSIDSMTLSKFEGKKSQPVFKQGVLASAKYPKGQVLVEFLRQIQWKPSKIIFVDDRMEFIVSVETELSKELIPLISFYYTAATDRPCQLDMQIADFQLDYLMHKGEWLSDEEAKKFLNSVLEARSSLPSENNQVINKDDLEWRIGGKIHFEEESGPGYIGIKEINKTVKDALKNIIHVDADYCSDNAKIILKKENNEINMTHYEERGRPGLGEEMHATLLYTQPRGFCNSETLKQICENLFYKCDNPPTVESVAKAYSLIIKPEWKFKISEVVLIKNGTSYVISARLLFDGRKKIYKDNRSISAGLHMTLANSIDASVPITKENIDLLIKEINNALKDKMIKVATKNGVADLEFGISGSQWRIRAEKRIP